MAEEKNYCLKCKKQQPVKNMVLKQTKNGRSMKQGNCSVCDTKVCKFVKKE